MIGISIALALILWLCLRRTGVAIALCFLLVGFVWRLVGAAYLDVAGPLYSYEADMMVGGDSLAANMFGALIALTVLVMVLVIRPGVFDRAIASLQPLAQARRGLSLGDLVFGASALFVIALFVDMFRIGVIPMLDCIERYEYLSSYAGPFHKALFKYGSLIALQMGTFAVYPRLLGGRYDWRFVALVAALFVYLPLTGNRFSGFYSLTLFFLTPFCLVWLLRSNPRFAAAASAGGSASKGKRILWVAVAASGAAIVAVSLLHSYANVRYEKSACARYEEQLREAGQQQITPADRARGMKPLPPPARNRPAVLDDIDAGETISRFVSPEVQRRFTQRILVQPIHLYFMTSERVINLRDWKPDAALDFIFDPELKAEGNRSIRFLMSRTLPTERAAFLESVGNQFAGGYPEVLLELAGPWGSWVLVLAFAAVTAWLLRLWMLAVLRGRFLTAFFAAYVYYAFVVMYVGGMLNFLIVWTFWAKVSLLVLFAWLEPYLERKGIQLLPWRMKPPSPSAGRP
jgi:hypothetical protein